MNLINSIKTFKKRYKGLNSWFSKYKCSDEVLEYFVNNYDNIDWVVLSSTQPLTESFIIKYKDKIDWMVVFNNTNIYLSYGLLEKCIYQFNLYMVYHNIIKHPIVLVYGIAMEIDIKWGNGSYIDKKFRNTIKKLCDTYLEKYEIDKLQYELSK